ncbi:MAG TPA: hypothetical protein VKD68_04220 [Methyloceanibacter sp.]|jgi:hypothetical protein|nr:hypothetical protein [Methyloceanibacter sp.]
MQVLLLAMLFCLAWTGTALAWGPESHVVIAMIAEDRLAPDVKAGIEGRVDRLAALALENGGGDRRLGKRRRCGRDAKDGERGRTKPAPHGTRT